MYLVFTCFLGEFDLSVFLVFLSLSHRAIPDGGSKVEAQAVA